VRHTFPPAFPLHESHCPVSTSISTNRAGLRIGSFLSPSSSMDGDPFCFFPWGSGTFAFFPVDSVQTGKGPPQTFPADYENSRIQFAPSGCPLKKRRPSCRLDCHPRFFNPFQTQDSTALSGRQCTGGPMPGQSCH